MSSVVHVLRLLNIIIHKCQRDVNMNDGSIKNKQDPGCKKILTLLGLSVMSAVKVKVKIRRIMRFQSPVQDFSRAAADLMYSSHGVF